MRIIRHDDDDFDAQLNELRRRGEAELTAVEPAVRDILADVRRGGDASVRRCIDAFERRKPTNLLIREFDGEGALERLAPALRNALEKAARRIRAYHERQVDVGYEMAAEGADAQLGLRVRPLDAAGVYAPGGKARYPSSVLMTAIPAHVAGVPEIILATPGLDVDRSEGGAGDTIRAAAHLAGVTAILDAGGAHAIAALAYGTETVPRVDKIVGPGNSYVTCAKKLVYGDVAIDGLAGPSEVLVIADDTADVRVLALDLLSQAEHDEEAYAMLLTPSEALATAVIEEVRRRLPTLERQAIAGAAIEKRAVAVIAPVARIAEVASAIGAEHVSLHGALASTADSITCAGALFIGSASPVAAGDYLAGPSHCLPTGGAVRFGSPLGVYDFVRRTSLIRYSAAGLRSDADDIVALARAEGLYAHAESVTVRTRARDH